MHHQSIDLHIICDFIFSHSFESIKEYIARKSIEERGQPERKNRTTPLQKRFYCLGENSRERIERRRD